jgi:hypothetical protein
MLGICCGSCFIAELTSHYEKFENDPLIYASARSCGCTSSDETALRVATAGHTAEE